MRRWLRWLREVREPFDIEDRIPDGPDTVWWWRRFYELWMRP